MRLFLYIIIFLNISCGIRIERDFDYGEMIYPNEIIQDVEQLKDNLKNKHININWEGRQGEIFNELDQFSSISVPVTIDSFEARLETILENIDDGHSGVIRQDSINGIRSNKFGVISLNQSMIYLRIGNFLDRSELVENLRTFRRIYEKGEYNEVIIDIRWNRGGNMINVKRALSYFLPPKTEIYHQIECKEASRLSFMPTRLLNVVSKLEFFKRSREARISGSPQIYLWINREIASGSLLFAYHAKQQGSVVIGEPPKGLYNTFGKAVGYKLKNSRIIYTLSTCRLYLSDDVPNRDQDRLIPDYVPEGDLKIEGLVNFINKIRK